MNDPATGYERAVTVESQRIALTSTAAVYVRACVHVCVLMHACVHVRACVCVCVLMHACVHVVCMRDVLAYTIIIFDPG